MDVRGDDLVLIFEPGVVTQVTGAVISGTTLRIQIVGDPGRVYSLNFTERLAPADWKTVGPGLTVPASGMLMFEIPFDSDRGMMFYRVVDHGDL